MNPTPELPRWRGGRTSNDVINTQEMDIEWNELGGHIINLTSKDYYCTRVGLRSYYPHL